MIEFFGWVFVVLVSFCLIRIATELFIILWCSRRFRWWKRGPLRVGKLILYYPHADCFGYARELTLTNNERYGHVFWFVYWRGHGVDGEDDDE